MMRRILVFMLGAALCAPMVRGQRGKAEAYVMGTDGKKMPVASLSADANGVLTFKKGKFQQKIKPDKYLYAWTPKPAGVLAADKSLKKKDYAQAVKAYEAAMKTVKFIGWDIYCMYRQAYAQGKSGDNAAAIATLKPLVDYKLKNPAKEKDLMRALKMLGQLYISTGDFTAAEAVLAKLGNARDDDTAAYALLKRGDILAEQGKKKDAVVMYMQVALLFPKGNKERPEALLKTANTLKDMNDARAKTWGDLLKKDYPKSSLVKDLK